jgi:hypothetical protein
MAGLPSWANLAAKFPASAAGPLSAPNEPNLRARAAAIKGENAAKLQDLIKTVKTAPIFMCSSHGIYDQTEALQKWTVPANTYIFQSLNIGDTLYATMDIPLWEIIQGGKRNAFLNYLLGSYSNLRKAGIPVEAKFKELFKHMVLYKPGDEIYARKLSFGGGRTIIGGPADPVHKSSREVYANSGFYRFDVDNQVRGYRGYGRKQADGTYGPYEILHSLQDAMVNDEHKQITDKTFVESICLSNVAPRYEDGEPTRVAFELAWPRAMDPATAAATPKIFIFSSCAAVYDDNSAAGAARITEIANLQRARIVESWEMGLGTLGGGSGGAGNSVGVVTAEAGAYASTVGKIRDGLRQRERAGNFFVETPERAEDFSSEDDNLAVTWKTNAGGRRKWRTQDRQRSRNNRQKRYRLKTRKIRK